MPILCIAGPTASGKTSRAIAEALARGGEIISVDSRQVYRMLDIGTEKIPPEEMRGVPHHLINIRDPRETYSAGDFVADATRLIGEITARGKIPVLVGGTHFYFDALFSGLPATVPPNHALRAALATIPTEELFARIRERDPRRASELDPKNRRRLVRALEIIEMQGAIPQRNNAAPRNAEYPRFCPIGQNRGYSASANKKFGKDASRAHAPVHDRLDTDGNAVQWILLNPPADELRARINARLEDALARGLIEEVERVRAYVGDERLNELGLEYRVVGEFLRGERDKDSLFPALSAKLHQYARRQRAWLRKLSETVIAEARPN